MMTTYRSYSILFGSLCALVLLAGCASKPKEEPLPPPPSADQVAALRASILEISPTAKIGTVTAVIESSPLAMVADLSTEGIKAGDVFSFVDSSNSVVANGTVVEIVDGKLAIRYTPVTRAPMVGDVAVKF